MTNKKENKAVEKPALHPRNRHNSRYNFDELIKSCPALKEYVFVNQYGDRSVSFADPDAVKMLNRALLQHFYQVKSWDIPEGYLCPPIPGRADYVHYMADLLAESNQGNIPKGKSIKVLDIGLGANCIYPLIGNHEYGWSFVGTDVDKVAVKSAMQIVADNGLNDAIEVRLQTNPSNIYYDVIQAGEFYDMAICNPPFHASVKEAEAGAMRKLTNLGADTNEQPILNFGGQSVELGYPGGEAAFISKMIYQSSKMPLQCLWYSTLVSKKDNLFAIYKALKKVGVVDVRTINMAQGQKQSRIVAWTFFDEGRQNELFNSRLSTNL